MNNSIDFTISGSTAEAETDLEKQERLSSSKIRRVLDLGSDKLIDSFTPMYYISVMGTGITSNILYRFPFEARWIRICSYIFFGCASLLFIICTGLLITKFYRRPRTFFDMQVLPKVAPFMGCLPMGYITLVNYIYLLTGRSWIIGTWVLWWIAIALSLYTAFVVFHFTFIAKRKKSRETRPVDLHPTMLLPIVTLTVAASSGGLFTLDLPSVVTQVTTIVMAYIIWAIAIFLAFLILAAHFWKLFVHKVPPTPLIFTSFIPIGVLGQGAYGILLIGKNAQALVMEHKDTLLSSYYLAPPSDNLSDIDLDTLSYLLGQIFRFQTIFISLFLIAFGYFYTFVAIMSVFSKIRIFSKNVKYDRLYVPSKKNSWKAIFTGFIKFDFIYWTMTFPLGTMALANSEFSRSLGGMKTFQVVGAIYAVAIIVIVIGCLYGTLYVCYRNIKKALAFT